MAHGPLHLSQQRLEATLDKHRAHLHHPAAADSQMPPANRPQAPQPPQQLTGSSTGSARLIAAASWAAGVCLATHNTETCLGREFEALLADGVWVQRLANQRDHSVSGSRGPLADILECPGLFGLKHQAACT